LRRPHARKTCVSRGSASEREETRRQALSPFRDQTAKVVNEKDQEQRMKRGGFRKERRQLEAREDKDFRVGVSHRQKMPRPSQAHWAGDDVKGTCAIACGRRCRYPSTCIPSPRGRDDGAHRAAARGRAAADDSWDRRSRVSRAPWNPRACAVAQGIDVEKRQTFHNHRPVTGNFHAGRSCENCVRPWVARADVSLQISIVAHVVHRDKRRLTSPRLHTITGNWYETKDAYCARRRTALEVVDRGLDGRGRRRLVNPGERRVYKRTNSPVPARSGRVCFR